MDQTRRPAPQAVADDDWTGRTLGEFRILRLIGRGGMGQVFLAEQRSLKRKVALKILRPELAANRTALERFWKEAEAVARITHANIVQVYAVGEQDGIHYMALEYVEGRNLRDHLNRKGPLELPLALSILRQTAAALQRASELGFVHRDIKPENILLTRKGEVKVTDFGLSRCFADQQPLNLTQTGVAMGTPLYMSPEQVQGKVVDPRSDIYSLGVTCYHMLAGQPPFRGTNAFDVALQHIQADPPPLVSHRPDLPAELGAIVNKMMQKNPDERYQTAKEIVRDVNRLREGQGSTTPTRPLPQVGSGVMTGPASGALTVTVRTNGDEQVTSEFEALVTKPLPRTRHRNRRLAPLAIAVVIAGVVVSGVAARMAVNRLTAPTPAKSAGGLADADSQPVTSDDERFAVSAARQFADPEPRELIKGLDFQITLIVYYLKRNRLDDAERFLRALGERTYKPLPRENVQFQMPEHPYKVLARLGCALVKSYRNHAQESTDALAELINQRQGMVKLMANHAELKRLLSDAINRNATNLRIDRFTGNHAELEPLRRPEGFVRPRPPFLAPKKNDKS